MELEKHVVSLNLSKKLKELNCQQESLFYWDDIGNLYYRLKWEKGFMFRLSDETHHDGATMGEFYSALTVSELGEIFPPQVEVMPGGRGYAERSGEFHNPKWSPLPEEEAIKIKKQMSE